MWGSRKGKTAGPKEKERVYTGFLGDLSPAQESAFASFKEWILASGLGDLERMHYDDHDLLRFCRPSKFKMAEMQQLW